MQSSQEGHPNVQGPHDQRAQRMLAHHAYASLVPASPPDRTSIAFPLPVEVQSQHLSLCTCVRPSRLQSPPICPHRNGGPCQQPTPQAPLICSALQKSICPWHLNQTLLVLEFWLVTTHATPILGAAFFKHKYLTNPAVTPEDRVIEAAGALA